MLDFEFRTPVAFFIFNRPENTERVFREIARVKPAILLIVGDGPRENHSEDKLKVKLTREIITRIDWPCDLKTNFSEINLGCKIRVSSGLDWVFKEVENAIILEDDCLPDPSFFRFAQELLERYRNDQRVGMIGGNSFNFGSQNGNASYFFSKFPNIWGWATWRDRWQNDYDVQIRDWPKNRELETFLRSFKSNREKRFWTKIFDEVYRGDIDTWDYQLVLASLMNQRLCILPTVNLISNIGAGIEATHTKTKSKEFYTSVSKMEFPLSHPPFFSINTNYDKKNFNAFISPSVLVRIIIRIKRQLFRFSLKG